MKYLFAFLLLTCATGAALGQDLSVDDIIARHVDSIGSKEKLDALQSRMAMGASEFESKLPAKKTGGKALIVSQADNLMFLASFLSEEYPFEKIGYFSEKVALPYVTAGRRSPLGAFIADHEKVLSTGLFAGSISTRWAALDTQNKKGRFQSVGTKKYNGRKVYVLDYFPKGGGSSEFTIQAFFDAETFRHVRTEYRHQINSDPDKFGQLGRQAGVKIVLTEEFGDHKTVDGITLPYSYRLNYLTDSNAGVVEFIWGIKIGQYILNQKLAPEFFTFDVK